MLKTNRNIAVVAAAKALIANWAWFTNGYPKI
jgi:hypothetical protein